MAAETTYTDAQVITYLEANLKDWYLQDEWICRKIKTANWKSTLMVITTVGHLAEAAWHHPDIHASYNFVLIKLKNHAAKGITDKDFELAAKIEDVLLWQPAKEDNALTGTPEDPKFRYVVYE